MARKSPVQFDITAKDKTGAAFRSTRSSINGLKSSAASFIPVATSLVGAFAFASLISDLGAVNVKFQDLKAGLKTATGSATLANMEFDRIREFAKQTPFEVSTLTDAYIRLKNLGLDPSTKALKAYGNIASAMPGKSIIDFVEAVADAATGEFERLKEFGIKASSEGEKVTFTFRGMATTIGKNADEIEGFLQSLAEENFGGAMAEKMDILSGKISNFKDRVEDLYLTIGENGGNSAMEGIVDTASDFVESLTGGLKLALAELGPSFQSAEEQNKRQAAHIEKLIEYRDKFEKNIDWDPDQKNLRLSELADLNEEIRLEGEKLNISYDQIMADREALQLEVKTAATKDAKNKADEKIRKQKVKDDAAAKKVRDAEEKADQKALDRTLNVVKAMEFEQSTRGKTAEQIEVMTALRRAEIDLNGIIISQNGLLSGTYSEEAEKIAELARATAAFNEEKTKTEETDRQAKTANDEAERARQSTAREGLSITEAMRTDQEKYNDTLIELNGLYLEGAISAETLARAQKDAQEELYSADGLAQDLGLTFESAFEKAVIGGENLSDVLKAITEDLIQLALRKAITEPLFDAMSGGGGWFSGLVDAGVSMFGGSSGGGMSSGSTNFMPANTGGYQFPQFASGGQFTVGGRGGTDNNLVQFKASADERVTIETPAQMRGRLKGGTSISNHYVIDARGADQAGLARLEKTIMQLNGSIEKRALAAVTDGVARNKIPGIN